MLLFIFCNYFPSLLFVLQYVNNDFYIQESLTHINIIRKSCMKAFFMIQSVSHIGHAGIFKRPFLQITMVKECTADSCNPY